LVTGKILLYLAAPCHLNPDIQKIVVVVFSKHNILRIGSKNFMKYIIEEPRDEMIDELENYEGFLIVDEKRHEIHKQ
jgi:hypothetical protein